jgi:hypothetical protein
VVWVFAVIAAVLVFAIAAVTVGREAFRLGHEPPATIFDFEEAVIVVADALPVEVQSRLSYDDVRELVGAELDNLERKGLLALPGDEPGAGQDADVVIDDDESVANALREAERSELDVTDADVFLVIDALHAYLAEIGAVGPKALGGQSPPPQGDGESPD